MSDGLGQFCWFDLITPDEGAAKAFYTEVVGWSTTEFDMGGTPYTMFALPGTTEALGGIMKLTEASREAGVPPHWIGYVSTPDIEATFARAVELGAEVHHGVTPISSVGRFAVLADPAGGAFALFASEKGVAPLKATADVGECAWHEHMTPDLDGALAFYMALFDWEETGRMDMGPMGPYVMFGPRGASVAIGGMMKTPENVAMPAVWSYYTRVPDIHGAVGKAQAMGGKLMHGPMEVPGGDLAAQLQDPQGAVFALYEAKAKG